MAQLARIADGVGERGRVRTSECVDACAYSNVVVVNPSPAGRAAGGRPAWLHGVLDADTEDDVVTWVRAGGPGIAEPPMLLGLRVFTPAHLVARRGSPDS